MTSGALADGLARIVGDEHVLRDPGTAWVTDASSARGLRGRADAVVLPGHAEEVAAVVGWCYERGVAVVPRGGGTGYSGGAVPVNGGVVLGLERLAGVRELDPAQWRMRAEAGARTADVRRRARESGLLFGPDPGAAETSQIGGNVATNAGGPHTFKYGVTGNWVTGLQAVLAPGELVEVGGAVRKDTAGYDLRGLLVGSEGTLGVITGVWLRLEPAPEAALPVVGLYPDARAGCAAIAATMEAGVRASVLEYLDTATVALTRAGFPGGLPPQGGFLVVSEADGSLPEATRVRQELVEVLAEGAREVRTWDGRSEIEALWRWRAGVSVGVTSHRGGKLSEDIVVPVERLEEAIEETLAIGARHRLPACSWGHAGDGNLHSTLLLDPLDARELARAEAAAQDIFDLAVRCGGSVSAEHGLGWVKRGQLSRQGDPAAVRAHRAIKEALDPKGLLNPGKKEP